MRVIETVTKITSKEKILPFPDMTSFSVLHLKPIYKEKFKNREILYQIECNSPLSV
jgi:hypothetical protein